METGKEKDGRHGHAGPLTAEGGGQLKWGGKQNTETKICLLMEDVSESRRFYEGEDVD